MQKSTTPSKTEALDNGNDRTKYSTEPGMFMFSCLPNGSYFPPLRTVHGLILPMTCWSHKTDLHWGTFPWWAVYAVTPCDFLQHSRHGLGLYRDGWQQLVIRISSYSSHDIWSSHCSFFILSEKPDAVHWSNDIDGYSSGWWYQYSDGFCLALWQSVKLQWEPLTWTWIVPWWSECSTSHPADERSEILVKYYTF